MLAFKENTTDRFYNRRLMAVLAFIFAVIWSIGILAVDICFSLALEASKLAIYMGVPASVAGLPIWQYFKAAALEKDVGEDG